MNAELSVADLRFAYTRGAEELFDGLTHRFTPGAVTALTGPSGRGKSTLLYVLGLMLTPSAGVVRLGDVDASALPDRRRARLRATSRAPRCHRLAPHGLCACQGRRVGP